MTADPVLDTSNPQALNAYSYGNNSPVSFSDPTGMVLQIDGRPAYIGSGAISSMSPANRERAYRYNYGVARNWAHAVTHKTPPTYPAFVGKENHQLTPKQRRARWETQFAYWSLEPPDRRPPDYDQFAAAFCSEFSDMQECEPFSPPSVEETIALLALFIPWGAVFRLGGEFVAGAVAGIEGSVLAGGAIAGGVRAGALGDLGASVTASKIAADAVNDVGGVQNCGSCAIAGDSTSADKPASAIKLNPDEPIPGGLEAIQKYAGSSWSAISGRGAIEKQLLAAGDGARGIVYGTDGKVAHVWNAVVQRGSVNFVDFQGVGPSGPASFDHWKTFYFVRTN